MPEIMDYTAYYDYWLDCIKQQKIIELDLNNAAYCTISGYECNQAKIFAINLVDILQLQQNNEYLYIAPLVANVPFVLQIRINGEGIILPNLKQPYPIVPQKLLGKEILKELDNYLAMYPPQWQNNLNSLDWQVQLTYAEKMLQDVTGNNFLQEVKNYAVFTLSSVKNDSLDWQSRILRADFNYVTVKETNINIKIANINEKINLTQEQNSLILKTLTLREKEYLACIAERGTGKTEVIKNLIAQHWLMAAILDVKPINILWVDGNRLKNATIFDCGVLGNNYISKLETNSLSEVIKLFINKFPGVNLQEIKQQINLKLKNNFKKLEECSNILSKFKNCKQEIKIKYQQYKGIDNFINAVQQQFAKENKNSQHLKVMQSLWQRQLKSMPIIIKWLSSSLWIRKNTKAFAKLYMFLQTNFPEENLQECDLEAIGKTIDDIVQTAKDKQQNTLELLNKTQADCNRLKHLYEQSIEQIKNILQIEHEIDNIEHAEKLVNQHRYLMFTEALDYWQADFLQNHTAEKPKIIYPEKIDLLLVEHAELVSPMLAGVLLKITEKAVIFGNNYGLANNLILNQLDYYNTEANFDDWQAKGVLASRGNLWAMVNQEVKHKLNEQWDANSELIAMQNNLIHGNLEAKRAESRKIQAIKTINLHNTKSEPSLGSRINALEAKEVVNWIFTNRQQILQDYQTTNLHDILAVYTTFIGQQRLLQQKLANLDIRLVQESGLIRTPIIVFSPVYTKSDQGPFCFDQGIEILYNLLANALDQVVIIGELNVFNPNMHSAAGKFAKFMELLY